MFHYHRSTAGYFDGARKIFRNLAYDYVKYETIHSREFYFIIGHAKEEESIQLSAKVVGKTKPMKAPGFLLVTIKKTHQGVFTVKVQIKDLKLCSRFPGIGLAEITTKGLVCTMKYCKRLFIFAQHDIDVIANEKCLSLHSLYTSKLDAQIISMSMGTSLGNE